MSKKYYKKPIINEQPIKGLSKLLLCDKIAIIMTKDSNAKKDSFNYKFFKCLNLDKMYKTGKIKPITEFTGKDNKQYTVYRYMVTINNILFIYYAGKFKIQTSEINTLNRGDLKTAFLLFIDRYARNTIRFYTDTLEKHTEEQLKRLRDNIDLRINENFTKSAFEIYTSIESKEVDQVIEILELKKQDNGYYNENKSILLYNENTARNIGEIDSFKLEFKYNYQTIKDNKQLSKLSAYQLFNHKKVLKAIQNNERISKVLKIILNRNGVEKMITQVTSKETEKRKADKPQNREELLLFTYDLAIKTAERVNNQDKKIENIEKRLRVLEIKQGINPSSKHL